MNTPILFLIFNRPETTRLVFEEIRKAGPERLFVAADGSRHDNADDVEKCRLVRDTIKQIDWDCEVKTLFRAVNLGCKMAVSSAIDWFFTNVEEGIILEDDCLPHQSFFPFCHELLEYYRNNERIMHISGDNFQNGIIRGDASYYFSRYSHVWGWASWRRAWQHYDVEMKTWPEFVAKKQIENVFGNPTAQKYFFKVLESTYAGQIDTWDYQWNYALWNQNGLAVLPNVNLVSNIGFGEGATHTAGASNRNANMRLSNIDEIKHPSAIEADNKADVYTFASQFQPPAALFSEIKKFIKHFLK